MAGASLLNLARQVQVLLVVLLLCSFWVSSAHADDLGFRLRGSGSSQYYEGYIPNLANDSDITLLSAQFEDFTVNSDMTKMQKKIGVRINRAQLADAKDIVLDVHEIDQIEYYQLNPKNHDWYKESEFIWPTDVLNKLGVDFENLGAVALLRDKNEEGGRWIAPVIFHYDKKISKRPGTYLFIFKLAKEAASLSCSIYYQEEIVPTSRNCKQIRVGKPFEFQWFGTSGKAGKYQLLVTGQFLTGKDFKYSAYFYHEPLLR